MKLQIILTSLFALLVCIPFEGFVLAQLYLWFVVPTYNVNPLTLPQAIGFLTIFLFLRSKYKPEVANLPDDKVFDRLIAEIKYEISAGLYYLTIGYIIKQFI